MNPKGTLPVLMAALSLIVAVNGPYVRAQNRVEFFQACPEPYWLNKVRIPDVTIQSRQDLMQYWRDDGRSDLQFAGVAYTTMQNQVSRPELVVPALKTMFYTQLDYPHYRTCHEFVLRRHFDYSRSINRYGGQPADDIGSLVDNLSGLYIERNQPKKAITLIEKLLENRGNEMNHHLLELIHLRYARALEQTEQYSRSIRTLEEAIKRYDGDWENKLNQELERIRRVHPYAGGWGWGGLILWLAMGIVGVSGVAGTVVYAWSSSNHPDG